MRTNEQMKNIIIINFLTGKSNNINSLHVIIMVHSFHHHITNFFLSIAIGTLLLCGRNVVLVLFAVRCYVYGESFPHHFASPYHFHLKLESKNQIRATAKTGDCCKARTKIKTTQIFVDNHGSITTQWKWTISHGNEATKQPVSKPANQPGRARNPISQTQSRANGQVITKYDFPIIKLNSLY